MHHPVFASASPPRALILLALLLLGAGLAGAQAADPDPERFAGAIQIFTRWDEKNSTPADAILFVGSSSIRGWKTASRFPDLPVVNRGFGGSHISDVVQYIEETVLRHRPRAVVFYAGDNDIAAGKSPEQVLDDYREFVRTLHTARPGTPVIFLAIKPSLARWGLWPAMQEANGLIASYSEGDAALHVLDLSADMLGPDGTPRRDLLVADGLHLTEEGYTIWTERTREALADLGLVP